MVEKTYVANVSFEAIQVGDWLVAEETPRLAALLGAGYIHEMTGPVYVAEPIEADVDEDDAAERFEEMDVVESPAKRGRRRSQ